MKVHHIAVYLEEWFEVFAIQEFGIAIEELVCVNHSIMSPIYYMMQLLQIFFVIAFSHESCNYVSNSLNFDT